MKPVMASMQKQSGEVLERMRLEPHTDFLLKRLKRHHAPTYRTSVITAYYSLLLAQELQYTEAELQQLYRTALLHDIGKLGVPRDVLEQRHWMAKGSVLSLQQHPAYGAELLEPFIRNGEVDAEAILQHHENLDGTGYPFGLTWSDISLNARILRIASSFTDMTDEPGAIGMGKREALEELYRWSDMMFDADLVDLLNHLLAKHGETEPKEGGRLYEFAERN